MRKAEHTRSLELQLAEMEEKYENLKKEFDDLLARHEELQKTLWADSRHRIKADIMDKVDAKLKEINGLLEMA